VRERDKACEVGGRSNFPGEMSDIPDYEVFDVGECGQCFDELMREGRLRIAKRAESDPMGEMSITAEHHCRTHLPFIHTLCD
jgi:hypothetical protein